MLHNVDFLRGTALILQGESLKAGTYVKHKLSLGLLREKIIKTLLFNETPEKLKVATGFISDGSRVSSQIDVLVYDSINFAPLYRWDDFVVVESTGARAAVEVKSNIDSSRFDDIIRSHSDVVTMNYGAVQNPICSLAFGLDGVSFSKFQEYVAQTLANAPTGSQSTLLRLPTCIAVQSQSYVCVVANDRGTRYQACACLADFSQQKDGNGMETGVFLDIYGQMTKTWPYHLSVDEACNWLTRLQISDNSKVCIYEDGKIEVGNPQERPRNLD